jgi:hypothetical protein
MSSSNLRVSAMLAYDDVATYTFVAVYDRQLLLSSAQSLDVKNLLKVVGLEAKEPYSELDFDLREFARSGHFDNPLILQMGNHEAFLECKILEEMDSQVVELQLGSMRRSAESLFQKPPYCPEVRDRLVACLEGLMGFDGFEFGFSLHLGDDENEVEYRDWFTECLVDSHFSLSRLVNHDWLSIHSIAAGGTTLQKYSEKVFENCPAWRIGHPSPQSVSVFFDSISPMEPFINNANEVTYEREALAHLRAQLKD